MPPPALAGVGELLRLLCPVTGGVMWRTAKADVAAEMGIPPQHHHTTVLRLSAIERHWYNRWGQPHSTDVGWDANRPVGAHTHAVNLHAAE